VLFAIALGAEVTVSLFAEQLACQF
jgi:hypothetical protein